jgi:hypothetical protein
MPKQACVYTLRGHFAGIVSELGVRGSSIYRRDIYLMSIVYRCYDKHDICSIYIYIHIYIHIYTYTLRMQLCTDVCIIAPSCA